MMEVVVVAKKIQNGSLSHERNKKRGVAALPLFSGVLFANAHTHAHIKEIKRSKMKQTTLKGGEGY